MSIKDILVYVDNDEACGLRLETATGLCNLYDAHLSGLYVRQRISIPTYAGVYMPVEVFETNDKETAKLLADANNQFDRSTTAAAVNCDFRDCDGDVSYEIGLASRYADLLILPQRTEDGFDLNPSYQIPDIMMGASCPALLLPDSKPVTLPPERVLLAWDEGRESAKAFKSALPLLGKVKKIDVILVSAPENATVSIAQHLNRHGFEVEVHEADSSRSDVGDILLKQAQAIDSQMIIMGAYGHSRLRELMLGGTTRHVIDHTSLPVLFSH
jgi:nucleotide-binding universal stress UspA family protein